MRVINKIILHCSATPEGKHFTAKDIDAWHRARGWRGIGYHRVILLDGTEEAGRPEEEIGAHAEPWNRGSLGLCYIGGVSANNVNVAKDTRTPAQRESMIRVIRRWMDKHRVANEGVMGHRDVPGVNKACPSFDAKAWWRAVQTGTMYIAPKPVQSMPSVVDPILSLQNALKGAGYDPQGLDGDWGPKTRAALNEFEEDHGYTRTEIAPSAEKCAKMIELIVRATLPSAA